MSVTPALRSGGGRVTRGAAFRPRAMPMPRIEVRASLRPSRYTAGRVKNHVTMMSSNVESPRKNANPCTEPAARKKSRTAARSDTVSAASTVRQAEAKPRSSEVRTERPERVSSFNRSKYTM